MESDYSSKETDQVNRVGEEKISSLILPVSAVVMSKFKAYRNCDTSFFVFFKCDFCEE
jgi:hypothetical protein